MFVYSVKIMINFAKVLVSVVYVYMYITPWNLDWLNRSSSSTGDEKKSQRETSGSWENDGNKHKYEYMYDTKPSHVV